MSCCPKTGNGRVYCRLTPGPRGPQGPTGPVYVAAYGNFSSNVSQPVASAGVPTVAAYNKTEANNSITLNGNNEIVFHTAGVYQIVASPEIVSDVNKAANCVFWFRKNNADVPDSASKMTVASKTAPVFTSVPWIIDVNANDNIQTMFASEEETVALGAFKADSEGYTHPAVPSIILTMTRVS